MSYIPLTSFQASIGQNSTTTRLRLFTHLITSVISLKTPSVTMKCLIYCHHITLIFSCAMTSTIASDFYEAYDSDVDDAFMVQIYKKFPIIPNKSRKIYLLGPLK